MKRGNMKRALILALTAAVMSFCLVGCGALAKDKIVGDWTASTINGQSVADYAASLGGTEASAAINLTIKDDDTCVMTSANAPETVYDIKRAANGFEVMEKGKKDILFSVEYNEKDQTLSYKLKVQDQEMTIVLKKGTADLSGAQAPAADDQSASGDDASSDDSSTEEADSEESGDEESSDDESSEDESAEGEESEDDTEE